MVVAAPLAAASSSSGGRPKSTGSIASTGGPPSPVMRSDFRCCFFSSLSRRLLARASSLRRFWNLVLDLLANGAALPRIALPPKTRTRAGAESALGPAPIIANCNNPFFSTISADRRLPGQESRRLVERRIWMPGQLAPGGAASVPSGTQSNCRGNQPERLAATGAPLIPLRADLFQLAWLALGLANPKSSTSHIFGTVGARFLFSHEYRAFSLRIPYPGSRIDFAPRTRYKARRLRLRLRPASA